MLNMNSYSLDELLALKAQIEEAIKSKQGNHHHHHADGGGCCGGHSEVQDTTTDDNDRDEKLELIIQCVREQLGDNVLAIAPSENITIPSWSADFEDYDDQNTVHVDAFLYNDDDIDDMVENKQLSRNRCCDCGSKNVEPLNFISHSASLHQLRWLFDFALKEVLDKSDSKFLDVGSRIGSVLYAAFLYTRCNNIMGIEINDYFYNLQKKVIKQQQLGNRVSVVLGDITSTNGRSLLSSGSFDRNISTSSPPDVVMFNNVFQFFVGEDDVDHDAKMTIPKGKGKREPSGREKLQHIWQSIRNSLTNSGTIIVAIPSLEEQFETAEVQQERDRERREKTSNNLSKKKVSVDLESWVKPLNLGKSETQLEEFQTSFGLQDEEVDDIKNVHLYEIL